ncbi:hydroxymethylbilane synthase [Amedibacillus sp. YH-ame6]
MKWILGTRGSKLAIAQSEQVKYLLEEAYDDVEVELKIIKTTGDKRLDVPLDELNDKGVFVKEIEEELINANIDLAVHSMKDMPSQLDDRLCFTKTLLREDARDVLILRNATSLEQLPQGAKIATGSKRRSAQLLNIRKDLCVCGIRGNVETRIAKMQEEKLDGIVLAAAGLHRLHMQSYISAYFEETEMVPACGQGALAIEIRKDSTEIAQRIQKLCDEQVHQEVEIERALLSAVDAGCHTPFGVRAHIVEDEVFLFAVYQGDNQELHQVQRNYQLDTIMDEIQVLAKELKEGERT